MKLQWIVVGTVLPFAHAYALSGGDEASPARVTLVKSSPGLVPLQQGGAQLLVNGSDTCATADPITGTGMTAYSNVAATTGTEGQFNTNCNFFGQIGVANDVWFLWT